jgi:hypothetical protein
MATMLTILKPENPKIISYMTLRKVVGFLGIFWSLLWYWDHLSWIIHLKFRSQSAPTIIPACEMKWKASSAE